MRGSALVQFLIQADIDRWLLHVGFGLSPARPKIALVKTPAMWVTAGGLYAHTYSHGRFRRWGATEKYPAFATLSRAVF
jgi:hypothetical protein